METKTYMDTAEAVKSFGEELQMVHDERIANKYDQIVSTLDLTMDDQGKITADGLGTHFEKMSMTDWAQSQIGEKCGIPASYWERMRAQESKSLLATNVNYWFHTQPANRLLRTFRGELMAFLSDRYYVLDNSFVAGKVLSVAEQVVGAMKGTIKFLRSYVSERTMSMTLYDATHQFFVDEANKKDGYWLGVTVKNSEVGASRFEISPAFIRQVCKNGMMGDDAYEKRHVGSKNETGDIWRERTQDLRKKLLESEIEDITVSAFDPKRAEKLMTNLRGLQAEKIKPTYIDITSEIFGLTDDENKQIWNKLEQNTRYEFVQAVTAYANDVYVGNQKPERSLELQKLGYNLTTNSDLWKNLEKRASASDTKSDAATQ